MFLSLIIEIAKCCSIASPDRHKVDLSKRCNLRQVSLELRWINWVSFQLSRWTRLLQLPQRAKLPLSFNAILFKRVEKARIFAKFLFAQYNVWYSPHGYCFTFKETHQSNKAPPTTLNCNNTWQMKSFSRIASTQVKEEELASLSFFIRLVSKPYLYHLPFFWGSISYVEPATRAIFLSFDRQVI